MDIQLPLTSPAAQQEERARAGKRPAPRPAPLLLDEPPRFAALLDRQLGQCRRYGVCAAVLWLTVEPPAEGLPPALQSALLEAVGARLASRVRNGDVVAQVGERCFGVVLLEAGRPEAEVVRTRLFKALGGPYGVREQRLLVSLRIGAAVFREAGLTTGRELVEAAAACQREARAERPRLQLVGD